MQRQLVIPEPAEDWVEARCGGLAFAGEEVRAPQWQSRTKVATQVVLCDNGKLSVLGRDFAHLLGCGVLQGRPYVCAHDV